MAQARGIGTRASDTQRPRRRRLIVNADDFGRSASINAAVVQAHREGILTTASLMVNEPSCPEAVDLAKANPGLGVGLHLTLVLGHSALPQAKIPGLVDQNGEFSQSPSGVGLRYFFNQALREQLRAEIHAQFERFRATGLAMDHVNAHLHLHLHPTVFSLLMESRQSLGITHLRLTFDPLRLNLRLAPGRLAYRLFHAAMFHALAARVRPALERCGVRHTSRVFGLLQNDRVDPSYLINLLRALPDGDSEVYSHPSLLESRKEFEALISPAVKREAQKQHVELVRYQDL